ncbi:MAG: sigma-54 dependent transcriptional regulator [Planctomycetota bacterium]
MPETALPDSLVSALRRTPLDLRFTELNGDLAQRILATGPTALVVPRPLLTDDVLETVYAGWLEEDPPGIIVLAEEDDPADRAYLLASGASHVLTLDDNPRAIAKALVTIAEAEQSGGREGPEGSGDEAHPKLADFLSRTPHMRRFLDLVRKVSNADSSLLITGETGVGKERLARAIHAESPRANGPFIAVNCGALPDALLESELFGHEKGAFTGADRSREGLFEQASGGTIFLDEIGEMAPHLQVKLLTVLQRREVRRIGGTETRSLDVRVMAATNRDVREDVASGRFREDLYYRLNVVSLDIPSLRERAEDIPDLVGILIRHFAENPLQEDVESISEEALAALMRYSWPGNFRELINVIERATLLCNGSEISLRHLPAHVREARQPLPGAPAAGLTPSPGTEPGSCVLPAEWLNLSIRDMREEAIRWAETAYLGAILAENRGHIAKTAKRAGIGTRALYDRMKRYDLRKEDYKARR